MKHLVFANSIDQVHDWAFQNHIRCSDYFVVTERHRCYGLNPGDCMPVFLDGWAFNLEVLNAYKYLNAHAPFRDIFEKVLGDEV